MPTPAANPVPDGMPTVTAHMWFNGNCREALTYYAGAFGAEVGEIVPSPDGSAVWHSMLRIGDTQLMAADAPPGLPEQGPTGSTTVGFFLYVDDCDAWFDRAVDAGCTVVDPLVDQFWGDRMGKVRDPFGHVWGIATHTWDFTEEEMAAAMAGAATAYED